MFLEEMLLLGINFPITQSSILTHNMQHVPYAISLKKNKLPLWC